MRVVKDKDSGKVRTMTRGQISSAHDALETLAALKLPFGALLKLLPIARTLRPLAEDGGKAYNAIVDAHAEKDDNGVNVQGDAPGTVKVREVAAFNRDVESLNGEWVKLPAPVTPLTTAELQKALGDAKIELRVLENLGPLLTE